MSHSSFSPLHPSLRTGLAALGVTALMSVVPATNALPAAPSSPTGHASASAAAAKDASDAGLRLAELERRRDARVGVFAVDTRTGATVTHRADERFALASTVKVPVAAVVLDRLSNRQLEKRVHWEESDLVDYSPVTEPFVDAGMTIRQLIDASVTQSDNTAANLLLDVAGGPAAVERELRRLGDQVTSVDRREPELNDWEPSETRDTSTPRALAATFRKLTLGRGLGRADRRVLNDELGDSLTGAGLVRAGVPRGWVVGDKSGSASYGTRNDVAVVRPPGRAPWVVVVMTSHAEPGAATDDALVAKATEIVVESLR